MTIQTANNISQNSKLRIVYRYFANFHASFAKCSFYHKLWIIKRYQVQYMYHVVKNTVGM